MSNGKTIHYITVIIIVSPHLSIPQISSSSPPCAVYLIIIKIGRFFVRSSLTRASSDCGRIFTIALYGVWKETLRASFYFYLRNGEISKTARISLRTAIFVVRTNPD